MKKALITSIMLLGLGIGQIFVPVSYAQEAKISVEKSEKDWFESLNLRIDLAQAKVATLRAKIALELENSSKQAEQALDEAQAAYEKARDAASSNVSKEIDKLVADTIAARESVANAPAEAKKRIDELVKHTDERLQDYAQVILDSDEAKLLKQRYAQLEAEAALLKAKLAEKADDTGKQAVSYLDEAKNWYSTAKANAANKWQQTLGELSTGIDEAKEMIKNQREKASDAITDLADRASAIVRGDRSDKPTK